MKLLGVHVVKREAHATGLPRTRTVQHRCSARVTPRRRKPACTMCVAGAGQTQDGCGEGTRFAIAIAIACPRDRGAHP